MIAARPQPRSGSGVVAQVVGEEPELAVARRGEGEALEELGEAAHQRAPGARRACQCALRAARSAAAQFSRPVTVTRPASAAARSWRWIGR